MTKLGSSFRPSAAKNLAALNDKDAPEAIGRRLRDMYEDVVNEPVPDEFLELLAKLDDQPEDGGDDIR